ncbi:DUF3429 domain-containing protein [Halofilum ochraceum]|uniref:DUF3429 domain-containing protein n=1 Tax=Halofilum ochraceum TaxID=1611323 RepID=UPI00082CFC63|nr:DUF3429 domain-containing protein [Halofilum ochraceum]
MDSATLSPRTAGVLGYAGLIPFVLAALMLHGPWPGTALAAQVFIAYGATILAFLGGIQWGLALSPGSGRATERAVVGVLPSLVAWLALLVSAATATIVLAGGFAALLLWERVRCPVTGSPWYPGLRARLTAAVLACHAAALAGIVTSA